VIRGRPTPPRSRVLATAAITVVTAIGLGACASREEQRSRPPCFGTGKVAAWYALDDRVLRVNAQRGFFQMQVTGGCPSLSRTDVIGFDSRDGRICGRPQDQVYVRGYPCRVNDVLPISRETFFGHGASGPARRSRQD